MGWDLGDQDVQCPRWDHTLRHGPQELEASKTNVRGSVSWWSCTPRDENH